MLISRAAERKHLRSVTSWLAPVVEQELGLVATMDGLGGVLQQLEKKPTKDSQLTQFEETFEENGMGSRTPSISSLTSIVSLMSPISPSPLFNRREEREAAGRKLRGRSASICDLVICSLYIRSWFLFLLTHTNIFYTSPGLKLQQKSHH